MTRVGKDHLIAVGAALEKARLDGGDAGAEVRRVRIDGVEVDAREARAAFAEAATAVPDADGEPGRIERMLDKIERGANGFEDKLDRNRVGHVVANILRQDPERVTSRSTVDIVLAGGEKLSFPVEVLHRDATAALQRASLSVTLVGMLPLLGQIMHGATALVAGVASLVTYAIGKRHLGEALGETALKHLTLLGVSFVPIVSNFTASLAVVGDREDLKDLRKPATVADIVRLGQD